MHVVPIDRETPTGAAAIAAAARLHGPWIATLVPRTERLFRLVCASAPGLHVVGGQTAGSPPMSVTGAALTPDAALAACLGEVAERLGERAERHVGSMVIASLAVARDQTSSVIAAQVDALRAAGGHAPTMPLSWLSGRTLDTGATVLVPADWCVRRAVEGPLRIAGSALSTGTAAGRTWGDAASRALLELIERDASALWWIGGRRPAAAQPSASALAAELTAKARLGQAAPRQRRITLLDITSDVPVSVAAAVSHDADGRGIVCGLAARLSPEAAASAAVMEALQMEAGIEVLHLKVAQQGPAGLSNADRRQLARLEGLNIQTCPLFHPIDGPPTAPPRRDDVEDLEALREIFRRQDLAAALVDLSDESLGVHVAKAVAPQLELLPSGLEGPRLSRERARSATAADANGGHSLL